MIKVFIADDHQLFLEGISGLVQSISNIEVVGTAPDGKQTLAALRQTPADVLLLDINMPLLSGIETLKILREKQPELKIIMLTMHNSHSVVHEVLEAGAHGYLLKNSEKTDLAAAIKAVHAGESYYVNEVQNTLLNSFKGENVQGKVKLTRREKEILLLICQENTTKEIANKLYLSINTVESHRKNLLAKTGAKNSVGLVTFAYENKLLN